MAKHTLRCHEFGYPARKTLMAERNRVEVRRQNRASPQGVAAKTVASFVARLANTFSIGFTSLRAINDFGSQRTRVLPYQEL